MWCAVAVTTDVTNISTYAFTPLEGLKELRGELQGLCAALELKGTILLAPEGINLFVAGSAESVAALVTRLRALPGLADLQPKVSLSRDQPFRRMLVRLKKEIIAFGVEGVDPARRTSPKLAPRELKRWFEEGRDFVMMDTRNDYEVRLGTFRTALVPEMRTFREFPAAVARLPEELKDRPVVIFCTGGIRCEKAGPFLEQQGFRNVHQLDGGILKYFEECGGEHYDGDCFVFDHRVGVDPALRETSHGVCFACQTPLEEEELADPRTVAGVSCPYCHRDSAEQAARRREELQEALLRVASPLPGAEPQEGRRPLPMPAACDRMPLLDALCGRFPGSSREEWRERCEAGRIVRPNGEPRGVDHIVRAGERLFHILPAAAEPPVRADLRVVHEDESILVLEKPAPLPMHSCGRFHRNTLQHLLKLAYQPAPSPRPVHRLDANTSGLVVLARTRHVARLLQRAFEQGEVEKTYLCRVVSAPAAERFTCELPIHSAPGPLGLHLADENGDLPAYTDFGFC